MAKYQKKPVTVEAQQLVEGQPLPPGVQVHPGEPGVMFVTTIQGRDVVVQWGEWIIAEPDGVHYYPCDATIFEERYELADWQSERIGVSAVLIGEPFRLTISENSPVQISL